MAYWHALSMMHKQNRVDPVHFNMQGYQEIDIVIKTWPKFNQTNGPWKWGQEHMKNVCKTWILQG